MPKPQGKKTVKIPEALDQVLCEYAKNEVEVRKTKLEKLSSEYNLPITLLDKRISYHKRPKTEKVKTSTKTSVMSNPNFIFVESYDEDELRSKIIELSNSHIFFHNTRSTSQSKQPLTEEFMKSATIQNFKEIVAAKTSIIDDKMKRLCENAVEDFNFILDYRLSPSIKIDKIFQEMASLVCISLSEEGTSKVGDFAWKNKTSSVIEKIIQQTNPKYKMEDSTKINNKYVVEMIFALPKDSSILLPKEAVQIIYSTDEDEEELEE